MKRIITLLFLFATLSVVAEAYEISSTESLQKALDALRGGRSYALVMDKDVAYQLVATEQVSDKSLFYVFESNRGGFIITGADHRANAILGYTDEGSYEEALQVPAFNNWLAECKAALTWLSTQKENVTGHVYNIDTPDRVFTSEDGSETLTVSGRSNTSKATLPEAVAPLLKNIKWNQSAPYNRKCPKMSTGTQCATGCVATATAQIMKFYEWPESGEGSNSYTSTSYKFNLSADFSQSVYDWKNMLDDYNNGYTVTQANAVAKLMSDVGIAEYMNYGPSSGAYETDIPYALANNFRYDKNLQLCYRIYFTTAEWNDLLKEELAAGRPIQMCGTNYYESSGHSFVLDGYNKEGLYHVNWGWGGTSNGYFDINYMNPEVQGTGGSNGGYPGNQSVVIGITPDTDGTSEGITDLYVSQSIDYYNKVLSYGIVNYGQKPFTGQLGFVAVKNDKVIKTDMLDISDMEYSAGPTIQCSINDLGFTTADVEDGYIYIYPAVKKENGDLYVPTSQVAFPEYMVLFNNNDQLALGNYSEDSPELTCTNLEVVRAYSGYDVKVKATITNKEDRPAYDRAMCCYVLDSNNRAVAQAYNFKYIEPGKSEEMQFLIPQSALQTGKTYTILMLQEVAGGYYYSFETGGETTFTLQSTGGTPNVTYNSFALSKQSINRGEELTASMKATNSGGFFLGNYYCFVFPVNGTSSVMRMPVVEVDLDKSMGSVTVSTKAAIDLEPGDYRTFFYSLENGQLNQIQSYSTKFTVTEAPTEINMITEQSNEDAAVYYDMMGRRVTGALKKGIYISNGKKILK